MKRLVLASLLAAICITPAFAALNVGAAAPDFTATGSLGGNDFRFNLRDALKKGPIVIFFYPSAYLGSGDALAHAYAESADQFSKVGAQVIGVSNDSLDRLKEFSADPAFCAGKFPVASDPDTKIATLYNVSASRGPGGARDVRGQAVGHEFYFGFVTYVIGMDGNVVATLTGREDLSPPERVEKMLAVVAGLKK